MVRKQHVELVDDLDIGPADETVSFGLDGRLYSIDLSSKHARELRDALATFVAAGQVVSGGAVSRRGREVKKQGGPRASDVRQWAKTQGIEVSDRGRVPIDLMVKFQAAKIS